MSKEQERAEVHRAIWQIANDLRGSVDGWDFKSYVLGMLFYRFVSKNLTIYINKEEQRTGNNNFDYAKITDKEAEFGRETTVVEKGFYILPNELFENVRHHAANDANLNETLSRVFKNIENSAKGAASEEDLKGLFDDIDANSNKLGATVARRNELLVKIINAIGELQLGTFTDNTIDAFGDAYEFLMTMYASNAGKSGGEFYTPQEVAELLAEITVVGKKQVNKVYDPACGSGSLLLKFAKVLGKENVRQGFFGQEKNITTYNLCRINMFLHDINYEKFDIAHGDTLLEPKHWDDEPFDAIVSNPPYSINWDGVTIATCIIVLKKSKTDNKTLFIDASKEFVHIGNKNKLSEQNRLKILNAFVKRENIEYFTHLVDNFAIGENDYNIAVSSYVEQEDTREIVDITQLNLKIVEIVKREDELHKAIDAIVVDLEGGEI